MPVDPSLVIVLDGLTLSASPGASALGIVSYEEPPMEVSVRYAADSDVHHGSVPLAIRWQQTALNFELVATKDSTETERRAAWAALEAKLMQLDYSTVVTVSDAPAETWTCHGGSVSSGGRTLTNLKYHGPVRSVSIPCYPVRDIA
jgi:hypothetical protein